MALVCIQLLPSAPSSLFAKQETTAKRKVAFLPFAIEIPGSYTYLRNGLASVLASRLASRAGIVAIPQGSSTEQMASALKSGNYSSFSQLLRQSGADFLILGSLTAKGDQFELSTHVFSNNATQPPKKFNHTMRSVDDAMTAVDEMAWDISSSVFGKPKPEEVTARTSTPSGASSFQTTHPERAYRENMLAGSVGGLESGGRFEIVSTQRSKNLPLGLMDMNAGDLDGDGTDEIVLLTSNELILYHLSEGQYQKVGATSMPAQLRYHTLTLADLNKNGRLEMYVSGSNGNRATSLALEWDGKQFNKLFESREYYLNAITIPGAAPLLLGQTATDALWSEQAAIASERGGGDIYQMVLDEKKGVVPLKKLALPKGITLFNLVMGDINGDGKLETLAINNANRLQVFDAAGTLLWTSSDRYGASSNFFGSLAATSNETEQSIYISTRIIIADLDMDGVNDVLIGKNRLETVPMMPNLRYFEGSSLSALKWAQGALLPLWETKKIANYTVNYQVLHPKQGSNQIQLVFAEAENSFPFVFWKSPSTYLDSITLRVNPEKQ